MGGRKTGSTLEDGRLMVPSSSANSPDRRFHREAIYESSV